jgi:hypothetical protein
MISDKSVVIAWSISARHLADPTMAAQAIALGRQRCLGIVPAAKETAPSQPRFDALVDQVHHFDWPFAQYRLSPTDEATDLARYWSPATSRVPALKAPGG